MWVFIRPRSGQDCYLLMWENRARVEFCPIRRFDGMDQIPKSVGRERLETQNCSKEDSEI
jgi:hypothetical protein